MDKPNLSTWTASVAAGCPIGTLVATTPNYGGSASSVVVSAKGGLSFTAAEVAGVIEIRTAGPMVASGPTSVVVTANNAAGKSQRTCSLTVTPRVAEPPPPPPPTTADPPAVVQPPLQQFPGDLPPDLIRPSYPPRAARMRLTGRGEAAQRVTTAAQVMPPRWWPAGQGGCLRTVIATRAGLPPGSLIRTQLDCHLRHPDGSARLLLIAAEAPPLEAGEELEVVLEPGAAHNAPGATLAWPQATAGRVAVVSMAGKSFDALGGAAGASWREGPLVIDRRFQNDAVGDNLRLVADLSIAADGAMTADVQWCSDVAMAGGGSWTGVCAVKLFGAEFNSGLVRHGVYSRLRRCLSDRPPPPVLRPDVSLILDAGLLPRFDLGLKPAASALTDWQQRKAASQAWRDGQPYNPTGIAQYMPGTGGRADIGFIPQWYAGWLIAGGLEWHDLCRDFADAAFAVPISIYDRATSSAMRGDGIRAQLWADGRDARFQPAMEAAEVNGGWTPDTSHKPQLHLVPFLLTGQRAHLDGLQAEAAWALMTTHPAYYRTDPTYPGLMVKGVQQRDAAWKMRDLFAAWWGSPAGDPFGIHCGDVLASNCRYLADRRGPWRDQHGDYAGWLAETQYGSDYYQTWAPWQADFLIDTLAALWQHGSDDAGRFLAFMADGFFGHRHDAPGWDPRDGVAYNLPGMVGSLHVKGWEAAAAELRRRGQSFAQVGWAQAFYGVYSAQSFVRLRELFPTRGHLEVQFRWLLGSGAPGLTREALAGGLLQHSVMPRGETRA